MKNILRYICLGIFLSLAAFLRAQCEVDAGEDVSICLGESIQIGGAPTVVEGANPVINWDNGAGNQTNPLVSPTTTTTYTVSLSSDGCNTQDEITVVVNDNPEADFTFNPSGACAGSTVQFSNVSTGVGLSYDWDFGNPQSGSNSSTATNPTHEFVAYGNGSQSFTVSLTVTDANGCTDTHTESVDVTQAPDPLITDQDIFSPFVDCGPPGSAFELDINNSSTTTATNTSYTIDWGDGSPTETYPSWTTLNHAYGQSGFFNITVEVEGQNGCSSTAVYEVFFGNNPDVALGGGSTIGLCAPTETLSFPILNTENNPPGTTYTVSYNDGSPDEVFVHPPPAAVEHVFSSSSCGTTSLGGFANSYHVRIIAENPCGLSSSLFEPVQTSSPPTASMGVSPGTEWCSNQNSFTFSNTSTDAFFNNNGDCTSLMLVNWSIDPPTGWTLTGGSLSDPNSFSASFDPGTYTITMDASNPCGNDQVSMEICATPPPDALFDVDINQGCAPHVVSTTNFSSSLQLCDNETYFWEVFPNTGISFANGSNTSIEPDITFSQEGTYTLQLSVTNACGTDVYSETISVTEPPTVDLSSISDFCQGGSINPFASFDSGGLTIDTYAWDFPGGSPTSSGTASPGSVTYNSSGNFTVSITATNACGSDTESESFTVESAPIISVNTTALNNEVCSGNSTVLTASGANSYSWDFDPSLNTTFGNQVTASPTVNTTYTVNGTSPAGCPGSTTVNVDVLPLPVPEITGDDEICEGDCTSLNVDVTGGTPPITNYSWIDGDALSDNGITNPTACPINSNTYTVTVEDSNGCIGSDDFFVQVNPLPNVNANGPVTLCNAPVPEQITSATPIAGVGETGVWSGSGITPEGVFTPNGTGTFPVTYTFTDGFGCVSSDDMDIVVQDPIPSDGGDDVFTCSDPVDLQLTANSPSGTWSSNEVDITASGLLDVNTPGLYELFYSTGAGSCLAVDTVEATVYSLPQVGILGGLVLCEGDSTFLEGQITPGDGNIQSQQWTPSAEFSTPDQVDSWLTPLASGTYELTVIDDNTCQASADVFVDVLGTPIVEAGPDLLLCDQPIAEVLTGNAPIAGVGETGEWTGNNTTIDGTYTPNGEVVEYIYYTFTNLAGCAATDSLQVTVTGLTEADAGMDFGICLNAPELQLEQPGTWQGGIVNASGVLTPDTEGDFLLTYSIGVGTCEDSDDVLVTVWSLPIADAGMDVTICEGDSVQLTVDASGDYLPVTGYSWSGGDALTSTNIQNPIAFPTTTESYNATVVDSNGCSGNDQVTVNVNAAPIVEAGADITVCDQPIAEVLSGFDPVDPVNGVWSGPGITNPEGEFTPFGVGTYTVFYEYTGGVGCSSTDSIMITVEPPVVAEAGSDVTVCLNNGIFDLDGFAPQSGFFWFGDGIIDGNVGTVDPTIAEAGSEYVYIETGVGTCYSLDSLLLNVDPLPIIDQGLDEGFCGNIGNQTINAFSPTGGTWEGDGIVDSSTGEFDPSIGTGFYDHLYIYTDPTTGCTDTAMKQVEVFPVPVADFILAPLGCTNSLTDFTNNSTGADDYVWDWGNGDDDFVADPNYIYPDPGFYDVELLALNDFGCQDSLTLPTEIINPPSTDFTLLPDEGCAPLEVTFENLSVGQDLEYEWDLAIDSSIDFEPDPLIYPQGDDIVLYEVILSATNFCGTELHSDTVTVFPQPVAGFGTDLDEFCSPWTVNLNNISTGNPDVYQWDWGDGTFSALEEPLTHTYFTDSLPTDYTIQLVTTNECGIDTAEYTITVLPNTVTAFFNTNVITGCEPLEVEFTDFSDGGDVIAYDFGDDNFTNNPNPTHTFTSDGLYTVMQTVNNGCSFDTTEIQIEVFPSPDPAFTTDLPNVCQSQPIQFLNETEDVNNVNWAFGDANTSNLTNPIHTYETGGTYPVTIEVTSNFNECIATLTQNVTVFSAPVADYVIDSQVGCSPFEVNFNNTTADGQFYQWDFGDNETASIPNPTHTFFNTTADPVIYDVTLIAQNLQLCADTLNTTVIVSPTPQAIFATNINETCEDPVNIVTNNNSLFADNYEWTFTGWDESTLFEPSWDINGVGTYQLALTASNGFGCADVETTNITIHPTPVASFSTSDPDGCIDHSVSFFNETTDGFSYFWDFGDQNSSNSPNPVHVYDEPGVYTVTLSATSDQGCFHDTTYTDIIEAYSLPIANFNVTPLSTSIYNPSIQVIDATTNTDFWLYTFGDGQVSLEPSPSHTFENSGDYTITLQASTINGCTDEIEKRVTIGAEFNFYVPNTFTPDGDGINEYFQPVILGPDLLEFYEFKIFDRWGVLVFETEDMNEGWIGDFRDANKTYSPDDVYTWQARIRVIGEEESKLFTGHVTLAR